MFGINASGPGMLVYDIQGDTIDGGTGTNSVDFSGIRGLGVSVDLSTDSLSIAGGANTIENVQSITGTAQDDTIKGGLANDRLDGAAETI